MGRSRRAAATSSDDSDGGAAPSSDPSPGGGGRGGRKKWTPGNSGSQQKARAKELRLEQERRKAERERRNEDKRVERDRREEAGAAEARLGATPPRDPRFVALRASRRTRRRRAGEARAQAPVRPRRTRRRRVSAHRPRRRARTRPRDRRGHGAGGAAQERRGGVEPAHAQGRRARDAPRGLSRPRRLLAVARRLGLPVAANAAVFPSSPGGDRASWNALVREPPYHLVLRVVARFDGGGGEDEETDEETLWSVSSHHRRKGDEASSSRSDASRSDALAILPAHCWEAVATRCDARGVACLSATCAALAELSRSDVVRKAQHAALFGRPAPPRPPPRYGRDPTAGTHPRGRAPRARARRSTRRRSRRSARAAVGGNVRLRPRRGPVDPDEADAGGGGGGGGGGKGGGVGGVGRRRSGGGGIGRRRGGRMILAWTTSRSTRTTGTSRLGANSARRPRRGARTRSASLGSDRTLRSEASSRRFSLGARPRRLVPRPLARHEGVGPWTAHRAFANSATAVSCDWRKIKLWFHGGDGQTEPGKRIATLPHPRAWRLPRTTPAGLGVGPRSRRRRGYFLAGDPTGHVTVWDADSLEVTAARAAGTARADAVDDALLDPDLLDGDARGVPAGGAVRALAVLPSAHLAFACGDRSRVVRAIDLRREDANHQDGETNLNRGAPTRALLSLAGWPDEDPASDPSGGGAATLFDVEDMIVTGAVGGGAAEYHGGTPTASFAPRGFEAPAARRRSGRRRRATGSPASSRRFRRWTSRRVSSSTGFARPSRRGFLGEALPRRAGPRSTRGGTSSSTPPRTAARRCTTRARAPARRATPWRRSSCHIPAAFQAAASREASPPSPPGTRAARSTSGRRGSRAATAPATPSRSSTCVARPAPARRSAVAPRRRVGVRRAGGVVRRGDRAAAAAGARWGASLAAATGRSSSRRGRRPRTRRGTRARRRAAGRGVRCTRARTGGPGATRRGAGRGGGRGRGGRGRVRAAEEEEGAGEGEEDAEEVPEAPGREVPSENRGRVGDVPYECKMENGNRSRGRRRRRRRHRLPFAASPPPASISRRRSSTSAARSSSLTSVKSSTTLTSSLTYTSPRASPRAPPLNRAVTSTSETNADFFRSKPLGFPLAAAAPRPAPRPGSRPPSPRRSRGSPGVRARRPARRRAARRRGARGGVDVRRSRRRRRFGVFGGRGGGREGREGRGDVVDEKLGGVGVRDDDATPRGAGFGLDDALAGAGVDGDEGVAVLEGSVRRAKRNLPSVAAEARERARARGDPTRRARPPRP